MITKRIKEAIDVFLDALNDGTLAKGNCSGCAVGNLVAASQNCKIQLLDNKLITNSTHFWYDVFYTGGSKQIFNECNITEEVIEEIQRTNFTLIELAKIEFVFETSTQIRFSRYARYSKEEIRADQLKGLEAVVKVMLEFDNCKETVREVFTEKAELIPV